LTISPPLANFLVTMSKAFVKDDQGDQDEPIAEPAIGEGPRHITPQGFKRLQEQIDQLWSDERPKVTAMVSAAAAEGDRSENAEYIYGKKRLREIDARIRYLSKLIDSLTVVKPRSEGDRIYFGAWVIVENEEGEEKTYRIVGPDETDLKKGYISSQSPVARALFGKQEGEWATVKRPKGPTDLLIVKISYQEP
jgi:transcription elongation factor GreB